MEAQPTVLIVEDDPAKARPTVLIVEGDPAAEARARRAITDTDIECDVLIARDGDKACELLFDGVNGAPTLVLLDLAVPKTNGFEVLARIRGCGATKRLPVVVISSSTRKSDLEKSLDLQANSFIQMGEDPEINETRLKLMLYYWIAVNQNVNT
jgi:CheY-like chemotaxis protein